MNDALTRCYRRAGMAVVATYLDLERACVAAVLADRLDDYWAEQRWDRERLREERGTTYQNLLARETIVLYAGIAAEQLAADPEHPLASLDSETVVAAVFHVHALLAPLESPWGEEDTDQVFQEAKHQLCRYYRAIAERLVHETLVPVIVAAAEEDMRHGGLTSERVYELVVAAQ